MNQQFSYSSASASTSFPAYGQEVFALLPTGHHVKATVAGFPVPGGVALAIQGKFNPMPHPLPPSMEIDAAPALTTPALPPTTTTPEVPAYGDAAADCAGKGYKDDAEAEEEEVVEEEAGIHSEGQGSSPQTCRLTSTPWNVRRCAVCESSVS